MPIVRDPSPVARALVILLVAVLFAFAAHAAPASRWLPIGPAGGPGGRLAPAPSNPDRVYLAAGSLLQSDDAGRQWREVPGSPSINALTVDPAEPSHLVAALLDASTGYRQAGIFESFDAGLSFQPLGALPRVDGYPVFIARLLFGPDGVTLYAGSSAGLLVRRPGADWKTLAFAGETVYAIAFDPKNPSRLLAASWGDSSEATQLSNDGGATWSTVLGQALYDDIVFDPTDAKRVFGSGGEGFRSLDGGRTWTATGRGLRFRGFAVDASGTVYGATGAGVSRSTDHGLSWTPSHTTRGVRGVPRDTVDQVVAAGGGAVLASGQRGLWRSEDGARSFAAASTGVLHHSPASLAVGGDGALYASDGGVFRTRNRGASWSFESQGLSLPVPTPVLGAAAGDAATVYAGSAGYHVFARTADFGEHWQRLDYPGSEPVTAVAVDPSDPRVVVVGGPETNDHYESRLCHVWRSEDAGDSWRCLTADAPELYEALTVVFHTLAPQSLLAATCCSFLRSDDRGLTWQRIAAAVDDTQQRGGVGFTSADGRGVVLASDGVVYVSRDGGRTVVRGGRGLPAGSVIAGLAADPRRPKEVYVALLRGFAYGEGLGVFVSRDGGASFSRLGEGLPREVNGRLALDAEHGVLYAGTYGRSVWRFDLPAPR